ncbi:energy-coupling factor ABC transporter ATP-binding protein [bacterium]|nr:energy-coupling factor ABC transporter ATP-binding protein [bacterium]
MIALEHLGFGYRDAPDILQDVTLTIEPGQRIVLAGVSGGGKSTLLRLLAGLITPRSGRITYPDDTPPRIGFVRQQPENQLVAGTVFDEIALGLEYQNLDSDTIERKVKRALERTGLEGLEKRAPSKLSGGQMQRLAFAAAWVLEPQLWLLDEPTSYLDHEGRARLHALLSEFSAETSMVYVASDPEEYHLTDILALLKGGRLFAQDDPISLFREGVVEEAGLRPPRSWLLRQRGWKATVPANEGESVDLPESPREQPSVVHSGGVISAPLCAKKVHANRRDFLGPERTILKGIDLELHLGQITALVGPSGAGKSTLIEVLAGLLKPISGSVEFDGDPPENRRGQIGVAFQFPERSFFAETVLDEVTYGARNLGVDKEEARKRAENALASLGLGGNEAQLKRSPFDLSGGEARRVALAAIHTMQPAVWLLDEPTAGLDDANAEAVGRMIQSEAQRGCAILIAGHDLDRFADWTNHWLLLRDGSVERAGDPLDWWAEEKDPWPAPATVRAWRDAGLPIEEMTSIAWDDLKTNLSLPGRGEGEAG